jgi:thiamine biosynthesis lipoprotein
VTRLTGQTMGTGWSVQVAAAPPTLAAALRVTLTRMIAAMSQWDDRSALSAFNRSPIGEWQDIPDTLATVLDAALAIGRTSGGAFDPAGGALADLWGFGPPGPRRDVPDDRAIADALARSGADAIELSGTRARRLRDVALDLSGIGKGHAVDALAETCRAHGARDFLVEIGGEFVGLGIQPGGQPWWVDLESPPGLSLPQLRIAAHGVAIATSGNYRRFLDVDDRRLSHTIDPRTGRPIDNGVASVSVIAADCMTADGWATALTVLGRDAGMAVAERHGLAVRMVLEDGREVLSPTLTAMLD